MRKILCFFSVFLALLFPKVERFEYESIQLSFRDSTRIELIVDGSSKIYESGTKTYNSILAEFEKMIEGSHQMPAFGVSIDELTKEEKNSGVWLEFKFDGVNYNSDLPFEYLLIKIENNSYGFNVIRKYEDKYDGRCFYISLNDNNMDNLYSYLINL